MRTKVALFVAVVLGLVAGFGLYNYVRQQEQAAKKEYRPTHVVAAAKFVKKGTPLSMKMLIKKRVPEEAVTAESVLWRQVATLLNQPLNQNVERGQVIQRHYLRLSERRLDDGLNFGERALTISVDNVTGVGGNVRPQSHVDIFGTFEFQQAGRGASAGTKTVRLLSDVTVLAVDNRTRQSLSPYSPLGRAGRSGYSTVTLKVTPAEAELLIFAQSQGVVTLALRHAADPGEQDRVPPEITMEKLLPLASQIEEMRQTRRRKASPISK